ncbi:succinate dehydrogenase assembly factor 2 [Gemmobacter sp.]|uniref:FAD assembly factor SdhE n=1 Tax=Gemmobacter sp. TaxID=1898957 RepID=UPI002AFFA3BA|nr:succinate dehydrogenase assembly factor 2 [Gemmobacter sp.]
MSETPEARLKRMRMRSWRRGTKEMDLVLGPYADARLAAMDARMLDAFDALLEENDQDLMKWVLGQDPAPVEHSGLVAELASFAQARLTPGN